MFLLKFFYDIYCLEIMSVISWGAMNVKDDALHEQNLNTDSDPVVVTLVTTEQKVA